MNFRKWRRRTEGENSYKVIRMAIKEIENETTFPSSYEVYILGPSAPHPPQIVVTFFSHQAASGNLRFIARSNFHFSRYLPATSSRAAQICSRYTDVVIVPSPSPTHPKRRKRRLGCAGQQKINKNNIELHHRENEFKFSVLSCY